MNNEEITAAQLAEIIGVQSSAISHILSERNKPSLDFILKLKNRYPELDLEWFITGRESNASEVKTPPLPFLNDTESNGKSIKKIKKIVLFYEDGSFEDYNN